MANAYGVDISAWQDDKTTAQRVDFAKMKSAGAQFVFLRANFAKLKDRVFDEFYTGAKAAGLPVGAYTFPICDYNLAEQINLFCDIIKAAPLDLPPVLDVEKYNGRVLTASQVKQAIKIIQDRTGRKPMIYTGFYVWRDEVKGNDPFFAQFDLWIATYAKAPMIPPPWTTWKFWQYTDKGDGLAHGVESANIDMNYYNGTTAELKKYAGIITPPVDVTFTPALWERLVNWAIGEGFDMEAK